MRRTALALAALALTGTAARAQGGGGPGSPSAVTLGVYTFTGALGDEATFPVDAQPTNGTFSVMRRGGGLMPSISANRFSATGWTMATAPDTAQYYAFRLTAAAGFQANLDSLVFDERRSATGVSAWQVRSSLDGFASVIAADTVPDDTNIRTQRIALSGGFNTATSVEFRIYGFASEAAAGTWRMDNVRLVGDIAQAGALVPTVSFSTPSRTVSEGAGAVTIPVSIVNPSATAATTVDVMLGTTGTATAGTDFTFTPATQTLTFPAGSTAAQNVTITLTDDAIVEGAETVALVLMTPSTGAVLGTPATFTLTIADNDSTSNPGPTQNPPLETIAAVTGNDADGVADRLTDTVRVRGVVTGPNTRTVGFSFSIQDATGGVLVFSSAAVGPVTGVQPGDQVEVLGRVTQFNGLTEIIPDSVYQISTAQPLPAPRTVTAIDESTENEIVQIVGPLTLPTPSQWVAAGSGFNVDVTDGTTTYQLRIVRGTDLYSAPAPTQPFSVIGVGGQFDNASPYLEGYQLLPRFLTDIVNDSTTNPGPTQNPPLETIAAVTGNDADGVADRLNDTVRVRGVVTGPNTRTVGFSFSIQDATGGVLVFSSAAVGPVTGVQPGDQVEVLGRVTQFNGLTEIIPDSVYQISTAQPLPAPRTVTAIDESTENEIVQIVGPLTLPTPAQWVAAGSGFNVDVTDGTTTYQLRIVRGTDLYNAPAPTQPFSVIGVGGQFDNASPYLEGYQLLPRFLTDIVVDSTAGSPRVQFSMGAMSMTEGNDSVMVTVTLVNRDTTVATTTVDVQLATTGTATVGTDFTFAPATQTLTFAAGVTSQTLMFDIIDDTAVEPNETVVLNLLNATGAALGTPATFTLTIIDNDSTGPNPQTPPLRTIATAVATDAQGVATLDGQAVRIRGIVTSPNIRTAGYSVTVQDASGWGITVFRSTAVGTQVLNQGDEVEVVGVIDQFNGLTEIIPDSFRTVATNQVIPAPRATTVLDETTESLLVKINGPLTIPNPAQWTNAAGGFTVDVTDGTTTYALRIPRGSAVIGTPAPTQPFRLTGTGGQFDNAAPYFEGYQIQPRNAGDIELVTGTRDEQASAALSVFPNPATDRLTVTAPVSAASAVVIDALGRTVQTAVLVNGTTTLEVSQLPAGVYTLRVGAGVKRFVKQ